MANALTAPAGDYAFGLNFNYAAWAPGTQIMLCNVPWNSDYRDVAYFATDAALVEYLETDSGPTIAIEKLTYAKPGSPVQINLPFNRVYRYNYLRVFNPAQPVPGVDGGRALYYFILDVEYIAPNNTRLVVQLDVWQSFCRNVTFGNCYIERGHVGIANSNNFADNGRSFLTVPEGMDIGNEYVVSETWEYDIVNLRNGATTDDYGILVASTTELLPDMGTVDSPKLQSAMGSRFESLPNGCALYYFNEPLDFENFQIYMSTRPWVSQGIISVTVMPKLSNMGVSLPTEWDMGQGSAFDVYRLSGNIPTLPVVEVALALNFRNSVPLGTRYANLKKFLTYPYSVVEVGTYSGNPLVLKPECINRPDLRLQQLTHVAPPSPRIAFVPLGYNAPSGKMDATDGEWLNVQTGLFDLPTFSVVNNGYLTYMAANRNAIAYQHSSADWSQQRALTGADLAASQATMGMNNASAQTSIANKQALAEMHNANATLGWRSLQGGANAAMNGAGSGRTGIDGAVNAVQGMANSAADYTIGSNDNIQRNAISTNARNSALGASNVYQGMLRDSNRDFANFAAKGDYANNIAGINAKVQDAKLIQPTTSGQIGGDAFNLATYKWSLYARLKTLQPAIMASIGEYWLRYGYAIHRFGQMPSNYQVMSKFTYWKLTETYLTSSTCPEQFKQTLRGIFEKGVTVWNDPSDIGNIDMADNEPLSGVTL